MKIKKIMEKPVLISSKATKKELKKLAKKHPHTDLFVVVDKNKNFLGDIHENDLFLMFIPNEKFEEIGVELGFDLERKFFANTAKELMNKHDVTCDEDDDVAEIALLLAKEEVNAIPVLNKKGKVVGMVNRGTLVRHLDTK